MRILAVAALAALTGCAGLQITYHSDPPGATLYQDGQPLGLTPRTLTYEPDETFKNGGCWLARKTTVKWASGAEASTGGPLNACRSNGMQQVYTFVRPDVPGRDVDMNFALQLQRNSIMQQSNSLMLQQMLTPPKPVTCNTVPWGLGVRTVCQ